MRRKRKSEWRIEAAFQVNYKAGAQQWIHLVGFLFLSSQPRLVKFSRLNTETQHWNRFKSLLLTWISIWIWISIRISIRIWIYICIWIRNWICPPYLSLFLTPSLLVAYLSIEYSSTCVSASNFCHLLFFFLFLSLLLTRFSSRNQSSCRLVSTQTMQLFFSTALALVLLFLFFPFFVIFFFFFSVSIWTREMMQTFWC